MVCGKEVWYHQHYLLFILIVCHTCQVISNAGCFIDDKCMNHSIRSDEICLMVLTAIIAI